MVRLGERRNGNCLPLDTVRLQDLISTISATDLEKIRDEDVLRYVAKYSRKFSSRKRAISELVKLGSAETLEYIALTCSHEQTKRYAINGLARLGAIDSLKSIIGKSDSLRLVSDACSGLAKNMDLAITKRDSETLRLISKHSRSVRQRKKAESWMDKILLIRRIKSIEA